MDDLINRQQAIDAVVSAMIDGADAELVEGVMELLPSAQPEQPKSCNECENFNKTMRLIYSAQPERKKGKWIKVGDHSWKCNKCNEISCCNANFCPDCGARMDGESDETD